jgi:hypothetical protein
MHLAPLVPDLRPMLARMAFSICQELDAGAVSKQVQKAIGATIGALDGERLLPPAQGRVVRHAPVQVRQLQQAGIHPGRLSQRSLEHDLTGRQNWIAASRNTAGRSGLSSCGTSQVMSLSSQISSDPGLCSGAKWRDQFAVRWRAGMACSCSPSNRMDACHEPFTAPVVQQRHARRRKARPALGRSSREPVSSLSAGGCFAARFTDLSSPLSFGLGADRGHPIAVAPEVGKSRQDWLRRASIRRA